MLEKQRLTYLSHLGIENYMPRRVLSGAAASQLMSDEALMAVSPEADLAKEPSATITKKPSAIVGEASVSDTPANKMITPEVPKADIDAAPSLQAMLDNSLAEKPEVVAEQPKVEASEKVESETAKENIRFTLTAWRIEPDVLVIDSREQGTALPTDRLLQNILRSIGYPLAQLPASELIRWPLFNEQQSCEQEARAMVQAYISAYCDKVSAKAIVLMGKDAARFALDVGDDFDAFYTEHSGQTLMQPQWSMNVGIAPSLADMLREPLQKRLTWNVLKTLFTVSS